MEKSFFQKVYDVVSCIPKGKVATYVQIATILGIPGATRQVGWALHANPNPSKIPCHRVVNKEGGLAQGFAFGGPQKQRELLEKEGVVFSPSGIVSLKRFQCSNQDLAKKTRVAK